MFLQRTWPAWTWALMILVFCLLPGDEIPREQAADADKIVHALLFTVLNFLLIPSLIRQYRFKWLRFHAVAFSFGFSIFFGAVIELFQHRGVQNREAEWADWLFDVAGSLLGIGIFCWIYGFSHIKNQQYDKSRWKHNQY